MAVRRLDANRLITLVHVARHGSLTGAARALDITASAVSQQMSALEVECGVQLIHRDRRGAALTAAGEVLLERAEEVMRQLEDTGTTMAQLTGELSGRVRVAAIASAALAILLPAVKALRDAAPAVTLAVSAMEPLSSLDAIDKGLVDLALIDVYDHVPLALPSHLAVEEIATEPLVLVTSRDSDVPRRTTLDRLKDQDWILPPADTACGAATRYACRSAGFEPRVAWETGDLLVLVAAVSKGQGIALLPRRAVADSIVPVDIRRLIDPPLKRRILLIARQGTAQRPIVRACSDAIRQAARAGS